MSDLRIGRNGGSYFATETFGPAATWSRLLTDDEVETIQTAMEATPFDPEALILSGAKTITWEAIGIRNRITNDDGVIVWGSAAIGDTE